MSAEARRRIGEATRKRWAALRAAKGNKKAPARKPKRKMSKEGRAAIIAATKKRWAEFHKRKAEQAAKKASSKVKERAKAKAKRIVQAAIPPVAVPVMP